VARREAARKYRTSPKGHSMKCHSLHRRRTGGVWNDAKDPARH